MHLMSNNIFKLFRKNFELLFWIGSLTFLGITASAECHYSFCLFKLAGLPWCPGCGIGHAIGFILQGKFLLSWQTHWLGGPALLVILHRIYVLLLTIKFQSPNHKVQINIKYSNIK